MASQTQTINGMEITTERTGTDPYSNRPSGLKVTVTNATPAVLELATREQEMMVRGGECKMEVEGDTLTAYVKSDACMVLAKALHAAAQKER